MLGSEIKIKGLDVILVRGDDAENFLQGQITNDIKLLEKENQAIYAGYCNPKGRLIAFFLVIKFWGNYFLFCPSSISAQIHKKLSMYVLRSKVFITMGDLSYFYFHGNTETEEEFKNIWGDVPFPTKLMETVKHPNEQNTKGLLSITKLPGASGRFMVLGEDETIEMIYSKMTKNSDNQDIQSWNESDIEAKIPNIFKETQEKFIPQSLNLDLINAINFKKGCYTGQEIVARTHYRGKIKRRMYKAFCEYDGILQYGDDIFFDQDVVGHIINFSQYNKKYNLLIELKIDAANKPITLKNEPLTIYDYDEIKE